MIFYVLLLIHIQISTIIYEIKLKRNQLWQLHYHRIAILKNLQDKNKQIKELEDKIFILSELPVKIHERGYMEIIKP